MSYESSFAPYGAHEMKQKYQRNMLLGMAVPVLAVICCLLVLPRPQKVTIPVSEQSKRLTGQLTSEWNPKDQNGTATRGSTTPSGVMRPERLRNVVPDGLQRSEQSLANSVQPVLTGTMPHSASGDGGRYATLGDYSVRPIAHQDSLHEKPPALVLAYEYPFDISGIHGIGLGTIIIPGDTVVGELNVRALRSAAKHMLMNLYDSMKVCAAMVIDESGQLVRWAVLSEHPKKAGEFVRVNLSTVSHRVSRIGGVPCPTYIERNFIICPECEDRDDLEKGVKRVLPPNTYDQQVKGEKQPVQSFEP